MSEKNMNNDLDVVDPRETPAFRGVLRQLEESRAENAKLASQISQFLADAERKKVEDEQAILAGKGEYEEAIKKLKKSYEEQVENINKELFETKRNYELIAVQKELVSHGVNGKPVDYLASEYIALNEKPDLGEWINAIKTDENYSLFFASKSKNPQPGDSSGRAASSSGASSWEQVKQDLRSPNDAVRKAADAAVLEHFQKTGKMPW